MLTNLGVIATKMPKVRGLRTIKKEILKLINTYVEKADDLEMIQGQMVPPLLEAILPDYQKNVPDAREAEVLNVVTSLITKLHVSTYICVRVELTHSNLQNMMEPQVGNILDSVFECTLDMINKDFSEYPDHRLEFFKLLRTITAHCFPALLKLDARQFKYVIDSCMWASKHDNRDVEYQGLMMCNELISQMAEMSFNEFFQNYFTTILQDVLFVLTDSDHKAGFKYQAILLSKMFYLVEQNKIQGPVYLPDQAPAGTGNKEFVKQFVGTLLTNAFSNLQP
jgi:exportin-1